MRIKCCLIKVISFILISSIILCELPSFVIASANSEVSFPLPTTTTYKASALSTYSSGSKHTSYLYTYGPMKKSAYDSYCHVDIPAAAGTDIYAVASGTVETNKYGNNGGYYLVIKHKDGTYSYYGHMKEQSSCKVGTSVNIGDVIGHVGKTGSASGYHLHFEWSGHDPFCEYTSAGYITGTTLAATTYPHQHESNVSSVAKTTVTITTGTVESITQTSALVRGSFTSSDGTPTECGMYMGTSESNMTKLGSDPVKRSISFHYSTSKCQRTLLPGTTYYYQAYVIVDGKEYKGGIKSFTTLSDNTKVSVTTGAVESITQTSALVRGKFTATGAKATECGMYMGTSQSSMSKLGYDPINKSSTAFYYKTGNCGWTLEPGTTYYYRAYVIINGKEYFADNIESFTTLPSDKENPQTPSAPEKVSVTLSSNSISEGESVTVKWNKAPNASRYEVYYITSVSYAYKRTTDTSIVLSNLAEGTYEISVIAINENGRTESDIQTLTVNSKQSTAEPPEQKPIPTPPSINTETYYCFVNTDTGYLSMRESASASSKQNGRIPSGAAVTVYPDRSSGNWFYVEYGGVSGYAYSTYLTRNAPATMTGTVTGTKGEYLAINDAAASSSAGKSNKIGRIPPGGTVTVYTNNDSGSWYWVCYEGIYGWAYSGYITLS